MWKMIGSHAGQAALATLASRAGQMAVEGVLGPPGSVSKEPYAIIKRELILASREIDRGQLEAAHVRILALREEGLTVMDVRNFLGKKQIAKMRSWERGESGGRAKLTSAQRRKIPSSQFALPKERKYPIQDLAHAKSARSYATTEYQDGNLTKAQWETVYRKTAERYPDLDPKTLVCEKEGRKKRCHSVVMGGRARGRRQEAYTLPLQDDLILTTSGKGYWSTVSQPVRIHTLVVVDGGDWGSLRAGFDPAEWHVEREGLIYTDKRWERELQKALQDKLGFSAKAAKAVGYSEQGMQGWDYVDLDVGDQFLREARKLR